MRELPEASSAELLYALDADCSGLALFARHPAALPALKAALAAWNAGEGTVRKAGGQMPDIAETEAHVHMVLELYWALLQRKLPHHAHGGEVVSCAAAVCGG